MKSLLIVFIVLFVSFTAFSQWDYDEVMIPETTQSDSFKVPNGYRFSGIQFPNALSANMDTIWFLVSVDPKGLGFDTLKFDGVKYFEVLTNPYPKALSLQIPRTYQWQWWKVLFDAAVSDSTYFYPTFTK